MKRISRIFTVKRILLCIWFLLCAVAALADHNSLSLRDIERFFISVAVDANSYNLTRDRIRADVELKLKMAGIGIAESLEAGDAAVYVEVKLIEEAQFISVATNVYVFQKVALLRNELEMYAITWRKSSYGYVGRQRIDGIQNEIEKSVDDLVEDYTAVNHR